MPMPPLRDIINDTPADATDVEWNFNTIEQHIRNELVHRDGTVAMTGPIALPADPTNPMEAATKQYVDNSFPIGAMIDWPVATVPVDMQTQWKIANGQILNVSEYTVLYNRYQNAFNLPGDAFGGTQFRLPDLRRRVAVGYDPVVGPFDVIGATNPLANADAFLPAHVHGMTHTHPQTQHTHSIDHGHGASSGTDTPDHGHNLTEANFVKAFGGGDAKLYSQTNNPGITGYGPYNAGGGSTGGATARHTHSVTVNNFSGSSGQSGAVATGNSSLTDTLSAGDAASVTNRNYPPYIVVNKLIKVL